LGDFFPLAPAPKCTCRELRSFRAPSGMSGISLPWISSSSSLVRPEKEATDRDWMLLKLQGGDRRKVLRVQSRMGNNGVWAPFPMPPPLVRRKPRDRTCPLIHLYSINNPHLDHTFPLLQYSINNPDLEHTFTLIHL
jgi:hypothetical protein